MVDTQQLLAWPVGFSLNAAELPELDDGVPSFDMKHLSTLDYGSISSSSVQSSLSPSLGSCISPTSVTYVPSPPQRDEHLTNMNYTSLSSYRREEPPMHSESRCWACCSSGGCGWTSAARLFCHRSLNQLLVVQL